MIYLLSAEQANSSIRGAVEKPKKAVFIFHLKNMFKKRAVRTALIISFYYSSVAGASS